MPALVWINGVVHPPEAAMISVFDHGLLYGDGVFEGMRTYDGKVFRLKSHLKRLFDSAKAIALEIPLEFDELVGITDALVEQSGFSDAYLRHVVTRGVGDLGIDPRRCRTPSVIIICDELKMFPPERLAAGLRVVTAGTPMPHRESLSPRVKSLNYLPHVLAKHEGGTAGADEVLMLDSSGHVAEGSGQNLFVVTDGVLRTPPPSAGILKGITRDVVIELATAEGVMVREELLNRYDVYTADEVFLTGTASEIVPVREVDARPIGLGCPGALTKRLMAAFQALVRGGGDETGVAGDGAKG
jgi:branched-chain amino acid aminotransferase